jgi:hypothetical protein
MTREALSLKSRFDIFKRDNFTCRYCGACGDDVKLEVDHVTPVSAGGTNHHENLATACFECNRGKRAGRVLNLEKPNVTQQQMDMVWSVLAGERHLPKDMEDKIRLFIHRIGVEKTVEAAEVAKGKIFTFNDSRWRYFCGVCWSCIKSRTVVGTENRPRKSHYDKRKARRKMWSQSVEEY